MHAFLALQLDLAGACASGIGIGAGKRNDIFLVRKHLLGFIFGCLEHGGVELSIENWHWYWHWHWHWVGLSSCEYPGATEQFIVSREGGRVRSSTTRYDYK